MDLQKYITENTELMYGMLKELCAIPAPSHHEEKRAQYCKEWIEKASMVPGLMIALKMVLAFTEVKI